MNAPRALLICNPAERAAWRAALLDAAGRARLTLRLCDAAPPEEVSYLLYAPSGDARPDFTRFTALRAILSLWAGVETLLSDPALPRDIPLCRMVDPSLSLGMRDYVLGHVMALHLGLRRDQSRDAWGAAPAPLARARRVSILGAGELGRVCAQALIAVGFDVALWSRSRKTLDGARSFAGLEELDAALARSDILIGLLPSTASTRDLLDAARIAKLPQGAALINAGRGDLIVEAALLAALRSGALSGAVLDVFRTEPLPDDHPFRAEPKAVVTPHIAAATRPETAAEVLIEQIARMERGAPPLHVVDHARGY